MSETSSSKTDNSIDTEEHSKTKRLIMDVAEKLFAERGLERTPVRSITEAAGANVASINYHFGSKSGLIAAVVDRRLKMLENRQEELIDQMENKRKSKLRIEDVVSVFVDSMFELAASDNGAGVRFLRLMYRMMMEEPEMIKDALPNGAPPKGPLRFLGLINRALGRKELDIETTFWDFHCMLSFTQHAINLRYRDFSRHKLPLPLPVETFFEEKKVKATVVRYVSTALTGVHKSLGKNVV